MAWQDTLPLVLRSVKGVPLDAADMDLNFSLIGAMLCDIVAGHSHDGVDSRALATPVQTDIGGPSGWVISENTLTGGLNSMIIGGKIQSPDWGAAAGTQIDLVNKTMKFGGSSAPKFSVAADGTLTATGAALSGAITGSTIDIGGTDTTSLHIATTGNLWSGAATFAAAPFSVSYQGALKALNATITGTITASVIQTAASGARVILDTTGLRAYNADPLQTVDINVDGSGWFGRPTAHIIEWTADGVVRIAGFDTSIESLSLTADGHTTLVSPGAIAFMAGTTGDPEFYVTSAGALFASNATISGAISAATIDIGAIAGTAFHVDIDGNIWSGAALFAEATFSVSNAGVLTATAATIEGAITATSGAIAGFTVDLTEGLYTGSGATRIQMKSGVGIWAGADEFADAPLSLSNAGVFKATDATISGDITATTGEFRTVTLGKTGVASGTMMLEYLPGGGSTFVAAGKTAFDSVDPGFILGIDDTDGVAKFILGGYLQYMKWDGDTLQYTNGLIIEPVIRIWVDGEIKTSDTALDGTGASAGVLINRLGIFAAGAGQNTSDANIRILSNGSAYFKGEIVADSGNIGGINGWIIAEKTITGTADSKIVSGIFESADWGATTGAQIDLLGKTAKFGGYENPKFMIDADGTFTAIGGTFKSTLIGPRVEIDAQGITIFTGGITDEWGQFNWGDGTQYGSGIRVQIGNPDRMVPLYFPSANSFADIHLAVRSGTPTGAAELHDICAASGRLYICTNPGTPGTWSGIALQSDLASAGTVTVQDTTDTTCFVGLFESATGSLGCKTDAGLTYNAGTGMLTATGFTGPLSGNASTATLAADSSKLNGVASAEAGTASTIVKRDASGDVTARLLRTSYANQSTIAGAIAFRVNNSADNYTRYCSDAAAIRTFIGCPAVNQTMYIGTTAVAINRASAALTLTGVNLTMADGGTIGQAAGPLLTFDDSNNYLEISGCNVGINTTTPQTLFHVAGKGSFGDSVTSTVATRALNLISTDACMRIARYHNDYGPSMEWLSYNTSGTWICTWDMYLVPATDRFSIRERKTGADLDRLSITTDGYVGIGTTSPVAQLSVITASGGPAQLILGDTGSATTYFSFKRNTSNGVLDITGAQGEYGVAIVTGGLSVGMTANPGADNLYVVNDCSANTFTDHTPFYSGDALAAMKTIAGDAKTGIDHSTLPEFARKKIIIKDPAGKTIEQEGRNLGAMISMQTVAIQQLLARIEMLESMLKVKSPQ